MQKVSLQEILVATIIYKPIFVFGAAIIGIPHILIMISSIFLAIICLFKKRAINKNVSVAIIFILLLTLNLFKDVLRLDEYIYNFISLAAYIIVFMLIYDKPESLKRSTAFYTPVLLLILLVCLIDNALGGDFTHFEGRATIAGYSNPLWAARDLAVVAAYLFMIKGNRISISVALLAIFIIGFLEARGVFIILVIFFMWDFKFRKLFFVFLSLAALVVITWGINPYSASMRLDEWYSIITNLHEIPLLGFGLTNYGSIPFLSLGLYSHNWIFDYILAQGFLGACLAAWAFWGLLKGLKFKAGMMLMPFLSVPIIYGLTGLTQGSLIGSLMAVVLLPFIGLLNSYYRKFHSIAVGMKIEKNLSLLGRF